MTDDAYLLLGLTAIVGALAGIVAFAIVRFASAARDLARDARRAGGEPSFMAAALEEAMKKLREQERATSLRAEASERLSGEIIANLTSGLLVVGTEGEVRTLNPAGRRMLGLPDADWSGPYRQVLATAAPLADLIDECLTSGRPIMRRAIAVPLSAVAHLGVTVSPMRDHEGVHGAICLFTDLSAVVELEEQVRLQDSLARLGELTAGLAHEFRNGLATIHGYARLIDPARLPADYHPYIAGIRAETDSLREVVTNFLNFARPTPVTLTPVDMRAIVERVVEDVRGEVDAARGTIRASGEFANVHGDEVLLRQALLNLCRNAVEACVEAGRPPEIAIDATIDGQGRALRLVIADNGPGIDPALGDRVFQPFVTGRSRGTGLGLALVQKIVVTHNGRVAAGRSATGGAAFQISLPLEHPAPSTTVT
ncbi:MAG TPA: ATP-binding protein [Vicinamibacterales bacterium]|nr:ATP-binding protein [Vicinamibacterales bacterium]